MTILFDRVTKTFADGTVALRALDLAFDAGEFLVLLGPSGSGKTTACRLGHQAMATAWGHPAAAIDTDQLYLNVDARWELPYDDARNAMVLAQATYLAISLFNHGWQTVIICGNSLFDPGPVRREFPDLPETSVREALKKLLERHAPAKP